MLAKRKRCRQATAGRRIARDTPLTYRFTTLFLCCRGRFLQGARLSLTSDKLETFTITLSNDAGEKVLIGYDKTSNNYFIDRTNSGKVSFEKGFAKRHTAPRFSSANYMDMTLIIDNASVELFADNGLTVMTEIIFPTALLSEVTIQSPENMLIKNLKYNKLKSIWK